MQSDIYNCWFCRCCQLSEEEQMRDNHKLRPSASPVLNRKLKNTEYLSESAIHPSQKSVKMRN